MPALPIGDCIKFGWETFKKRPWILIGALLLVGLVYAIPGILTPHPEVVEGQPPPPPTTLGIVMGLVSFVVSILASLGLTSFSLRAHDNIETVTIGDLWNPDPVWRYLGAYLLILLIVIVGFILLVIPGIIASLGLSFATYLVIDRGMQPVASIKESWRITKGHKWQLFLLLVSLMLLNILGLIALFVGILVTIPITWLAVTHAYRTLSGPGVVPTR